MRPTNHRPAGRESSDPSTAVHVKYRLNRHREPRIVAALLVTFLVLAIVKPWSLDSGAPAGSIAETPIPSSVASAGASLAGATGTPTPTQGITDPDRMDCLADALEQLVLLERWPEREVRTWVAVTDLAAATDPSDPRLRPVVVFSSHVVGLGICAPLALVGPDGPAARILDVAAVGAAGDARSIVVIGPVSPITEPSGETGLAVLYGAPRGWRGIRPTPGTTRAPSPATSRATSGHGPGSAGATAAWPTGSYVITFRFATDGPDVTRLLRIDLVEG